jgi:hypothetical protein
MRYHRSHEDLLAAGYHLLTRTAKGSAGTASVWLFFYSPNRRRPKVSAEIDCVLADNLLQKTARTARSMV